MQDALTIRKLIAFYDATHAQRVVDRQRIADAAKPLLRAMAELTVHDLDDTVFVRYANSRRAGKNGRPVRDSTIRRELQHLRAVLNHAARNHRKTGVSLHDLPHIALPAKAQPRSVVLTQDELDALMAAAQPDMAMPLSRVYLFVALARWTAARRGAIESLTWDRVSLVGSPEAPNGSVDYREPGRVLTAKRRVRVPIDSRLRPILDRARGERVDEFVVPGGGSIRHAFEAAAERAGLPHAVPHAIRHTWATDRISRGAAPALVAAMMGDTLETVMRNYVHIGEGALSGLVD